MRQENQIPTFFPFSNASTCQLFNYHTLPFAVAEQEQHIMEKERQSGEFTEKVASPILPLVNPVLEDKPETKKPESSKGSIPAAVYIAYV